MTSLERVFNWLWRIGMGALPLAAVCYSWYQFHAQSRAQASSAAYHVLAIAIVWTFWSLGGLMWFQKFNKQRMGRP